MSKYFHIFVPVMVLWIVGFLIETLCYKAVKKLIGVKSAQPEENESVSGTVTADAEAMHKHFKISFIFYMVTIMTSLIIPLTELRWLLFFGCAMLLCPVLYDVLYVTVKKAFESKERMLIAIPSLYNILIIIITLFLHYFAYMQKKF
ncbi:hypothetical protein MUJ63_11415 [Lachnospiraceae bacterium NSJ-143]|nr:hypothetical protein [Lachnospiraceae bacterium NSJ-143]